MWLAHNLFFTPKRCSPRIFCTHLHACQHECARAMTCDHVLTNVRYVKVTIGWNIIQYYGGVTWNDRGGIRNIQNSINLWDLQKTAFLLVQREDIYLSKNIVELDTSCTMKDDIYFDYQLSARPERKKEKERLWSVLIACFVAAFGPFSFGYGMGYSSAAVTQLEKANATDLHLDKEGITWFSVSCFSLMMSCLSSLLDI